MNTMLRTPSATLGRRSQRRAVEQVAGDALDAVALERGLAQPGSLKRATPITRLPGAARLAMRASVGPILPPTPSTMMSPSTRARSATSPGVGSLMKVSSVFDVLEALRQGGHGGSLRGAQPAMPSKRSRPWLSARILASAIGRLSIQKPQSGWM